MGASPTVGVSYTEPAQRAEETNDPLNSLAIH
jgi:hypothetical protein